MHSKMPCLMEQPFITGSQPRALFADAARKFKSFDQLTWIFSPADRLADERLVDCAKSELISRHLF